MCNRYRSALLVIARTDFDGWPSSPASGRLHPHRPWRRKHVALLDDGSADPAQTTGSGIYRGARAIRIPLPGLGKLGESWGQTGRSRAEARVAGPDNGKISSQYNAISGETVQYVYDSLNRLSSAPTPTQTSATIYKTHTAVLCSEAA